MTNRVPTLLGVLAIALVALISTNLSAGEVIELTNDNVVTYEQPCYVKSATQVLNFRGITTWCDRQPGVLMCTSVEEPKWCPINEGE